MIEVADCRDHGRISITDDDGLINDYIDAATSYAEFYQGRCLRQSAWHAVYDCFPACGVFYMPNPPLVSTSFAYTDENDDPQTVSTSITYTDGAGATQTLATSVYVVDAISDPGRIALKYGQTWPVTLGQIACVTVTFVAGYLTAAAIPARTRHAIRVLAQHAYEYREPIVDGSIANVPLSVIDMLDADKLLGYR